MEIWWALIFRTNTQVLLRTRKEKDQAKEETRIDLSSLFPLFFFRFRFRFYLLSLYGLTQSFCSGKD